jgi:hypothetical protein
VPRRSTCDQELISEYNFKACPIAHDKSASSRRINNALTDKSVPSQRIANALTDKSASSQRFANTLTLTRHDARRIERLGRNR